MSEELRETLRAHLGEVWGRPHVDVGSLVPFGDGHSGFTYLVDVDGEPAVIRVSPPGARIAGPADVGRQGRIMARLGEAGLPVPEILACSSEPVLDGRSFALMRLVEGDTWEQSVAQSSSRLVVAAVLDVMRRVHALEPEATGIGEDPFTTPSDELDRWRGLLERADDSVGVTGSRLAELLEQELPASTRPTLVHGDFHYGNFLFRDGAVVAIFDWEIAELGDPLVDLGSLAVATIRRRYDPEPNPTGGLDIGLEQLIEMHGGNPARATWFVALACFKYAAILGYNTRLHRSGRRVDPIYDELGGTMTGLIDDGIVALTKGLPAVETLLAKKEA